MSDASERGDLWSPEMPGTTLSALLDGEVSAFEVRRLLEQLDEQPDVADRWARYSLGRSVLEGDPCRLASDGFSAKVMDAVEREAGLPRSGDGALDQRWAGGHRRWMDPLGRVAVAASVAVAVFLGMELSLQDDSAQPAMMAGAQQNAGQPSSVRIDADAQQRLNEYIQSVAISGNNSRNNVDDALAELENLRQTPQLRTVSDRELVTPDTSDQ